jgi:hypothetical protein
MLTSVVGFHPEAIPMEDDLPLVSSESALSSDVFW